MKLDHETMQEWARSVSTKLNGVSQFIQASDGTINIPVHTRSCEVYLYTDGNVVVKSYHWVKIPDDRMLSCKALALTLRP